MRGEQKKVRRNGKRAAETPTVVPREIRRQHRFYCTPKTPRWRLKTRPRDPSWTTAENLSLVTKKGEDFVPAEERSPRKLRELQEKPQADNFAS